MHAESERRWWDFDQDGDILDGNYVEAGKGRTANGERLFLVIEIEGRQRTLWLHHSVLESKVRRANEQAPITRGEHIVIERLGERESASTGRPYMNYDVRLPDRPQPTLSDLLGTTPEREQQAEPAPPSEQPSEATAELKQELSENWERELEKEGAEDDTPF